MAEDKYLWTQEAVGTIEEQMLDDFVLINDNGFSVKIPANMHIITNNYYTEGVNRYFAEVTGNDRIAINRMPIGRIREMFNMENRILFASSSDIEINIFSYPCGNNSGFDFEKLRIDELPSIINEIINNRERKVIELMKPPSRLNIQDVCISTIGSYLFLEFTKVYGGDIINEKCYCVRQGENILVTTFHSFIGDNSSLEKKIIESIVLYDTRSATENALE
jgi:hypothetical protein